LISSPTLVGLIYACMTLGIYYILPSYTGNFASFMGYRLEAAPAPHTLANYQKKSKNQKKPPHTTFKTKKFQKQKKSSTRFKYIVK
jgi:hypothetical protein